MSKNKKQSGAPKAARAAQGSEKTDSQTSFTSNPETRGKRRFSWWVIGLIALFSLGTLGAGLKYLDEDAKREIAKRNAATPLNPVKDESFLNGVNPFLPAPAPDPTPQLSKEYLYAGSRLLAVEDAAASAAPPADLAIWRPNNGEWWVMGQQGSQQTGFAWGQNGDAPVPGDYDGDGKTDFSVFRPTDGNWYIVDSSTSNTSAFAFGTAGDKPAPADYDGDGRTDAAVFRQSNGTWYIRRSSDTGLTIQQFGLSTDKPAAADYDGDGRADIGVWRGTDKIFYSLDSSTNTLRASSVFAQTSSEAVSADYDGDGRADHAIRDGADWIILKSSTGTFETVSWQQGTDLAVPNDYDGDGKVDIAVWRASNGDWYIRQSGSSNSLRQEHWGQAGDIPVPAFYRR